MPNFIIPQRTLDEYSSDDPRTTKAEAAKRFMDALSMNILGLVGSVAQPGAYEAIMSGKKGGVSYSGALYDNPEAAASHARRMVDMEPEKWGGYRIDEIPMDQVPPHLRGKKWNFPEPRRPANLKMLPPNPPDRIPMTLGDLLKDDTPPR